MNDDAKRNLEDLKNVITKQFGKGSVVSLADRPVYDADNIIHSGSIGLDIALGIGGYPRGRIVEIYGPESSGKTTLTLHAISNCQKNGGACAFVDTEHALDVLYAQALGVDFEDNMLLTQPDTAEEALEITTIMARSGMISLIVVDSVAAMVPKAELEGEAGDSLPGLHARLMSQAMRKLTGAVDKSRCTVMFTNQLRMKIGVMFGNPETTTGGNALKFYASQRIDVRRADKITGKNEDDVIGNKTRIKVVKNKLAPPFKTTEFNILYGKGIDRLGEIMDYAVMDGLVEKSGAWFKYEGKNIAQGMKNAVAWLGENPKTADEFEKKILAVRGLD
jgi:recombination protein RecA